MKQHLEVLLKTAIQILQKQGHLPADLNYSPSIEHTRDKQHGDFASNIALTLAKAVGRKPRELAEIIVEQIPVSDTVQKMAIAGPGFINFFMASTAWYHVIHDVLHAGANYGRSTYGVGQRIHLEFVSSNPTGPLHVGHGRGAAYGAALGDLLEAVGYQVHREYYVNDGGRQMDILATSVWLRYLELWGEQFTFPSNGYKGDYIFAIAQQLKAEYSNTFHYSTLAVFKDVPPDEPAGGDKEQHIDALIERTKILLGLENREIIYDITLNTILNNIRDDLAAFGVRYQDWFSERKLIEEGDVDRVISQLQAKNYLYEKDGALWFRATEFGDDKDRVMVRENGQPTYFAVDAAHYLHNLERGFTQLINVLGSDHHGYEARLQAVIQALGYKPSPLKILFVQFAVLYRGKERVQMSTRSGSFVTLRELREEVGADAARFFYVMRKCEQHMDFDLELAKSKSNENPVYYVQYAHARICSVLRQATEKQVSWDEKTGLAALDKLTETHEIDLLMILNRYAETILSAALNYEPHLVAHYLRDLAQAFHSYYNAHAFLVADEQLRNARIALILATRQILANGLHLLGVSAPETM